jgi:UDP-N-acetylglucosamine 2-epimerase (non-hydrolysing)
MLDQVLEVFEVTPDVDLDLMQPGQTLPQFTARAITAIDGYFAEHSPDLVLVQGDTTTVFCAALAAYYRRIPVGHVEAGLRTGDRYAPYPEEINRVLTSHLGSIHFAPTARARDNLLREGIADDRIHVTGNTVIDALHFAVAKVRASPPRIDALPDDIQPGTRGRRVVLITGHRRESFGPKMEAICRAIRALAKRFADCAFVYPVHLNPHVSEPVHRILRDIANVHLIEPLGYLPFVGMMERAHLVLTDSGGVQEEAPSLGKPVLVTRDVTERPEALEAGAAVLVGTCEDTIVNTTARLLVDATNVREGLLRSNPYGDGHACARIVEALRRIHSVLGATPPAATLVQTAAST